MEIRLTNWVIRCLEVGGHGIIKSLLYCDWFKARKKLLKVSNLQITKKSTRRMIELYLKLGKRSKVIINVDCIHQS